MITKINNYFPESDNVGYNLITDAIKVYPLTSPRTGGAVKNQFVIRYNCALVRKFQSYDTTCLTWDGISKVLTVYPEAFTYSQTTSKYSAVFLRDEIGMSENDIAVIRKLAKTESYGRDCPLYIQLV